MRPRALWQKIYKIRDKLQLDLPCLLHMFFVFSQVKCRIIFDLDKTNRFLTKPGELLYYNYFPHSYEQLKF